MKESIYSIECEQINFARQAEKKARETKKALNVSEQTATNIRNMINKVVRHLSNACPTFTHSDDNNVIRLEIRL